jgi:hypothetical protein
MFAAVALSVGCAAAVQPMPTVIEVLPTGYVVEGQNFATPAAMRQYVIAQQLHDVRLVPRPDTSYARVKETFVALQDLGLSFGIVGHERREH